MKRLWSKILKNGPLITILVLDSVTSAPQCIRQPRLVVYHTPKQTRRTRSTVVHAARCTRSRYLTLAALCITVLPQVLYTSADSAKFLPLVCNRNATSQPETGRYIVTVFTHTHKQTYIMHIFLLHRYMCVCVCVCICVFVFVCVTVCVYTYEYYMLFSFWRRDF